MSVTWPTPPPVQSFTTSYARQDERAYNYLGRKRSSLQTLTGDLEGFVVMGLISMKERNHILIVEAKRSLGEATKDNKGARLRYNRRKPANDQLRWDVPGNKQDRRSIWYDGKWREMAMRSAVLNTWCLLMLSRSGFSAEGNWASGCWLYAPIRWVHKQSSRSTLYVKRHPSS